MWLSRLSELKNLSGRVCEVDWSDGGGAGVGRPSLEGGDRRESCKGASFPIPLIDGGHVTFCRDRPDQSGILT